jgi:hypothetical protein
MKSMRFRSKLLRRHKAAEPILPSIYDVQMKPDGHVEGEDEQVNHALEGAKSILRQSEKTENGLR